MSADASSGYRTNVGFAADLVPDEDPRRFSREELRELLAP